MQNSLVRETLSLFHPLNVINSPQFNNYPKDMKKKMVMPKDYQYKSFQEKIWQILKLYTSPIQFSEKLAQESNLIRLLSFTQRKLVYGPGSGQVKQHLQNLYKYYSKQQEKKKEILEEIFCIYFDIQLGKYFDDIITINKNKISFNYPEFQQMENRISRALMPQTQIIQDSIVQFNNKNLNLKIALLPLAYKAVKQISVEQYFILFQNLSNFLKNNQISEAQRDYFQKIHRQMYLAIFDWKNQPNFQTFQLLNLLQNDQNLKSDSVQELLQTPFVKINTILIQIIQLFSKYLLNNIIQLNQYQESQRKTQQKIFSLLQSYLHIRGHKHPSPIKMEEDKITLIQQFQGELSALYSQKSMRSFLTQKKKKKQRQTFQLIMFRQIIYFLKTINFKNWIQSQNRMQKIMEIKIYFRQQLNQIHCFYQMQRENLYLQLNSKILLLEVYQILQIPFQKYVRIQNEAVEIVDIYSHFCNIFNDVCIQKRFRYQHNNNKKQIQLKQLELQRQKSSEYTIQVEKVLFSQIQTKSLKQLIVRFSIFSNQTRNAISSIDKKQKQVLINKLKFQYDFKDKDIKQIKQFSQYPLIDIKNAQLPQAISKDDIQQIVNRFQRDFYSQNLYSLRKLHSQRYIKPYKEILNQLYTKREYQISQQLISIELKLFEENYDEVINIIESKTVKNWLAKNHQKQLLFEMIKMIYDRIEENEENNSEQSLFQQIGNSGQIDNYQRDVYQKLYKHWKDRKKNENSRQENKQKYNPLFTIPQKINIQGQQLQNMLTGSTQELKGSITCWWLISRKEDKKIKIQFDFKKAIGRSFQEKDLEFLSNICSRMRDNLNGKGICKLEDFQLIQNKKMIFIISINAATYKKFLGRNNLIFNSAVWNSQNRENQYTELKKQKREYYLKKQCRKDIKRLQQISQDLIKKTLKNLIKLTSYLPQCSITRSQYICQYTKDGFCQSISINPFFLIIDAYIKEMKHQAGNQIITKLFPFSSNLIRSQILNIMQLRQKEPQFNIFRSSYRNYQLLISQNFWENYQHAFSHIILQNTVQDAFQTNFTQLPLFKRSHQKINTIIFAYEKIKRIYIENYICNNQAGTPAISKKNKLTLNNPNDEKNLIDMKYILHGKQFRQFKTFDKNRQEFYSGIIHYEACSIFNHESKRFKVDNEKLQLYWYTYSNNQDKQFIKLLSHNLQRNKIIYNFFYFLQSIRNPFPHETFKDRQNVTYSSIQKLQVVNNDYPQIHSFLYEIEADLQSASINEALNKRINKCKNLMETIKQKDQKLPQNEQIQFITYNGSQQTYCSQLIKKIKAASSSHTCGYKNICDLQMDNQSNNFFKDIINTLDNIFSGKKTFQIPYFDQNKVYSVCLDIKIGMNTIKSLIFHLLFFLQRNLRAQTENHLFKQFNPN